VQGHNGIVMRRRGGLACRRRGCFRGNGASRRREGKAPPRGLLVEQGNWRRGYASKVEEDVVLDGAVGLRNAVNRDRGTSHQIGCQGGLARGGGDIHRADSEDAGPEVDLVDQRGGTGGGVQVHGLGGALGGAGGGNGHGESSVGAAHGETGGDSTFRNVSGREDGPGSSPGVGSVGVIPSGIALAGRLHLGGGCTCPGGTSKGDTAVGGGGEVLDGGAAAVNNSWEGEVPPLEASDGTARLRVVAIGSVAIDVGKGHLVVIAGGMEVMRVLEAGQAAVADGTVVAGDFDVDGTGNPRRAGQRIGDVRMDLEATSEIGEEGRPLANGVGVGFGLGGSAEIKQRVGVDLQGYREAQFVLHPEGVGGCIDMQNVTFRADPDAVEGAAGVKTHGHERAVDLIASRGANVFANDGGGERAEVLDGGVVFGVVQVIVKGSVRVVGEDGESLR